MIDIVKFVRDFANSNCLHSDEYECDKQEGCYACISTQIAKHDAEVKEKAVNEFRTKVSKDIEFFTEKVKLQVYDLVLEVENFTERIKEHKE